MTLEFILVFLAAAILLGFISHNTWRTHLLLATSVLFLFALQPALSVRYLDFYLPTLTLLLAVTGWILTSPREKRNWRANWLAVAIIVGIVLVLSLTRYLGVSLPITASRPPQFHAIVLFVAAAGAIALITALISSPSRIIFLMAIVLLISFLAIIKLPALTQQFSIYLRLMNHQSLETASPIDIRWLGFSYVAFRLIHTLRDRQTGRLPEVSLSEYIVYIVFFPTLVAGPIDRIERFVVDLRKNYKRSSDDWGVGGKRIIIGLFKKLVIADSLALIALNSTNAAQVNSSGWTWILLYAFALQIYFDFSGYTDIAIGLGKIMGFKLPENFNSPYLKPNITQFWNNWHMSLTQWFRAYYFNPLTRSLRTVEKPLPIAIIIFITQVSTMVLIGMWHGLSWGFVLWGLWHGLGLFAHNRWSEWTKGRFSNLANPTQKLLYVGGVFITFNFVVLGWIFFVLPNPTSSVMVFMKLIGFN